MTEQAIEFTPTKVVINNSNSLIDHPSHYGGDTPYETIKVLEEWYGQDFVFNFCLGNVIKYLSRQGKKQSEHPLKDIKKAQWYLNKMVQIVQERTKKDENSTTPDIVSLSEEKGEA